MWKAIAVAGLLAGCVGGSNDSPTTKTTDQAVSGGGGTLDGARVPLDFVKSQGVRQGRDIGAAGLPHRNNAVPNSVPGVDSIANFSGSFTADGFDGNNQPQSQWHYTMVGADPSRNQTTHIRAPLVPITVELLDTTGHVATLPNGTVLRMAPGETIDATAKSPVFGSADYNSGRGQFNDQLMRTQFWGQFPHGDGDCDHDDGHGGYHTVLHPRVLPGKTIQIPAGSYYYALKPDGSLAYALVDINVLAEAVFPTTATDTTTVLGSLENAGAISTKDLSSLLMKDVYMYDGNLSNCCILGFHTYDAEPGTPQNHNKERRFVMDIASWLTPGIFGGGFADITPFSHEVSEIFADPFIDNATPWWLSSDPVYGGMLCQNNLENGDVMEVFANASYPLAMNGRTYHPQNVALLQWFADEAPSSARAGAYSFPDETSLLSLSPHPLQAGCVAPQAPTAPSVASTP